MGWDRLIIDVEPRRLLVTSEPYVIYTARGYQPVVNVLERRTKREFYLFIAAKSLSNPLESLRKQNDGKTTGLEFWLHKEGAEKRSSYILEE